MTLLGGRYEVIQALAEGGFGKTFLATDTQMPSSRRCVIKQLKPVTADPVVWQLVRERFHREAAILEELGEHDQIPRLYAHFTEQEHLYLVQEFIEGQTLSQIFKYSGKLSESFVKDVFLSLLQVLEFIHQKGVIHRDIKPDNIILRRRDSKPVLIDFGAVREIAGTVLNSHGSTTSSIVIGTPGFMPSEQAAGKPILSSDLYALGFTCIVLLTGKYPQELGLDARTGELVWRDYAPQISPAFGAVLERMVCYHPRDRYPTATDVMQAMQPSIPSSNSLTPLLERPSLPSESSLETQLPTVQAESPSAQDVVQLASPLVQPSRNSALNLWKLALLLMGSTGVGVAIALLVTLNKPNSVVQTPVPTLSTRSNATSTGATNPLNLPSTSQTPDQTAVQSSAPSPVPSPSAVVPVTPHPASNPVASAYSFLSERDVTDSDLVGKTALELDIMRNEIFARHGRRFHDPTLQSYFDSQPWYRPLYSADEFPNGALSPLEQKNAAYILQYQAQHGLR